MNIQYFMVKVRNLPQGKPLTNSKLAVHIHSLALFSWVLRISRVHPVFLLLSLTCVEGVLAEMIKGAW